MSTAACPRHPWGCCCGRSSVLEQEGADVFFGEPSFDVADLMRITPDGKGVISVLELSDVMAKPRLFSTFMLWLLAQLYQALPEAGDLPQPKLAFFFDEAHLLFDDASKALMDQVELTVRLIRSKGVGVYFVTQSPTDVPSSVLAQLGNRVQHALRAFTPEDADALRKTARTFPISSHYDVENTITSLGTGEALVTVLSPRGVPTPLAATRLLPPDSLMAALPADQFAAKVASGMLGAKYGTRHRPGECPRDHRPSAGHGQGRRGGCGGCRYGGRRHDDRGRAQGGPEGTRHRGRPGLSVLPCASSWPRSARRPRQPNGRNASRSRQPSDSRPRSRRRWHRHSARCFGSSSAWRAKSRRPASGRNVR